MALLLCRSFPRLERTLSRRPLRGRAHSSICHPRPQYATDNVLYGTVAHVLFGFCTVRQHQSAFVPLGPHVEKDVPKRLVQLVRQVTP